VEVSSLFREVFQEERIEEDEIMFIMVPGIVCELIFPYPVTLHVLSAKKKQKTHQQYKHGQQMKTLHYEALPRIL